MFRDNEEEEMNGWLEKRTVKCSKDKICANILIAVIPAIKYDTYDIFVHMWWISQL